ncbi:MAG: hypothetical protein ACRCS3_04710 [Paracoccaceae bacterium]
MIFPHVPKTGGTTLFYHFRKALGDSAIYSYGAPNRPVRFLAGLPLLEEMSSAEIASLRLIQGHGVNERVLSRLSGQDIRLLTILRNPVSLVRSRFNHRTTALAKVGRTVSPTEFLDHLASNQVCQFFCNAFPALIDDPSESLAKQAIAILRKFHYVFVTEKLDSQTVGFMTDLGLPTQLEKRRVAETYHFLDVPDEVIIEKNQHDMELFEAASRMAIGDGVHNGLGFDAAGLAQARARIREEEPEIAQQDCYNKLADSLCRELLAETGLAAISADRQRIALKSVDQFEEILRQKWAGHCITITPERAEISARNLRQWQVKSAKMASVAQTS